MTPTPASVPVRSKYAAGQVVLCNQDLDENGRLGFGRAGAWFGSRRVAEAVGFGRVRRPRSQDHLRKMPTKWKSRGVAIVVA